jgi:hypothetical protein
MNSPKSRFISRIFCATALLFATGAQGTAPTLDSMKCTSDEQCVEKGNKFAQKFQQGIAQNVQAAQSHYWGYVDCKRRKRQNTTTTIPLPGSHETWVDASMYSVHYTYTSKKKGLKATYLELRQYINTQLKATHTVVDFNDGLSQWTNEKAEQDHVVVSIDRSENKVMVSFRPPLSIPIPDGSPCTK